MRHCLKSRYLAALLASVMLSTFLSGCAEQANSGDSADSSLTEAAISTEITTQQIAEIITTAIREQSGTSPEPHADPLAFRPEDYAGDLDAFVYGLLVSEYELCYNVFQAAIELPDGDTVFGIAYTDYADYYESDDGIGFFPAGFLALIGEPEIPTDAQDKGLEIIDLELENSPNSYVYAYECKPFMEHCIIWGQYLQYGVDDTGTITYKAEPYQNGKCDETLGALYSYDDEKTVFDPDVGEFIPLTGVSLNEQIDYAALEADINRLLENQDTNYVKAEVETTITFAQEALNSYLLSVQTESFMGIPVSELAEKAAQLNPWECIRITPEGTVEVPISGEIPKEPTALTKWVVGVSCGIAFIASEAAKLFVPASTPIAGAVGAAAIDVFMQVVVENQTISNVNWKKVAVSAVSGALLAWACPLAASDATGYATKLFSNEALGKLTGYAVLTFGNALVSGATGATMCVIDGKSSEEVLDAFLWGAGIAAACTVVTAAVSEKVLPRFKRILQNTKPGQWLDKLSKMGEKASAFIGKHQIHLGNQQLESILAPKSIQEAAREASRAIKMDANLLKAKVDNLPSDSNTNFIKTDADGNRITKNEVLQQGGNCKLQLSDDCDPRITQNFTEHNITELDVDNGIPNMEPLSEYTFTPNEQITSNRTVNYENYKLQLAEDWSENPGSAPEFVKQLFSEDEIKSWATLSQSDKADIITDIWKQAELTPHEELVNNVGRVYLVDTYTHSKLSHYGGVATAKAFDTIEVCKNYIYDISRVPVIVVRGTLIA